MNNSLFRLTIILSVFAVVAAGLSCSSPGEVNSVETPTEGYKRLYNAVKSKNTDSIRKELTKGTLAFAESVAQRQNSPLEKVLQNGFTATTFSETLPEIRDERLSDTMGAIEVRNTKDNRWEDLPYILEDGKWKLAVGELFSGTYKSPGPGTAAKEMQAANAAGNNMIELKPSANGNANVSGNFGSSPRNRSDLIK
ncbi:MAG: hypothetical protein WBD22_09385 [Pyrinomonadaceae bacterium]